MTALTALAIGLTALASPARADEAEAKKIFNQRCTACHTFGKGIKVGPDLKGVTDRRQRAWLLRFVRSSQKVIDSGDATAVALFQQFKQQRMPDWSDLSEEQVGSILDWLAANGPEKKPADERIAELATPAEVELGRSLFHGRAELTNGGMACASCHAISERGETAGGSFGPELTSVYAEYRDRAMTLFLREPCFRRMPESDPSGFLLPPESFAIKAYLRETSLPGQKSGAGAVAASSTSSGGSSGGAPGASSSNSSAKTVAWTPPPGPVARRVGRPPRRSSARDEALFLGFPAAALLLLVIGLGIRHARSRRDPDGVRRRAQVAWRLFSGAVAWRAGLAATFIAHVAGLLVPGAILAWNGVPLRLYILEGSGFLFGLLFLAGWVPLMWRHLASTASSRAARASEVADCVLLSLVFAAIASGLATAGLHRWGSSWASGTLAPYLATLVRGEPVTGLVGQMPFLVKLHVLTLFGLIAALPFSSAALIPIAAVDRVLAAATRPIAAIKRGGQAALARMNPARWLWPEEDLVEGGEGTAALVEEGDRAGGAAPPDRAMVYRDSKNPPTPT
ncbi:MAG TPA: respiratory nitrate reductase subunit gamma [Kofleriaceae bacterium]|nr:respiratory nitrate reductase subunit gamma [Kofleriaceae bacterium]